LNVEIDVEIDDVLFVVGREHEEEVERAPWRSAQ